MTEFLAAVLIDEIRLRLQLKFVQKSWRTPKPRNLKYLCGIYLLKLLRAHCGHSREGS
jgi:hypothetical protein